MHTAFSKKSALAAALLAAALSVPAQATSVSVTTDGSWYQFDVDEVVAGSGGLEWIDAITDGHGLYSGDGSALSFTFTLNQAGTLSIVDGGFGGDEYQVSVNGVNYFTSTPLAPGLASTGTDFDAALANTDGFSYLNLFLNPGTYTVTGLLQVSASDPYGNPYNASVGGLRVSEVPVPAAAWLLGSGLLALAARLRRRRA
ncbi:MAG TPA: hypothetical protein VFX11_13475 [Candidatus Kapabacteria bacterium]|nr:hypothetical protein [Candidatus Kapabacteria bacterium]